MTVAIGVPLQGGERIERAYWACVTAKVPIREQLKLYQDAFEKAKLGFDPTRDFPQYKGYIVQRAEVIPGKAARVEARDRLRRPAKIGDAEQTRLSCERRPWSPPK